MWQNYGKITGQALFGFLRAVERHTKEGVDGGGKCAAVATGMSTQRFTQGAIQVRTGGKPKAVNSPELTSLNEKRPTQRVDLFKYGAQKRAKQGFEKIQYLRAVERHAKEGVDGGGKCAAVATGMSTHL